jgi:GMP synthase (glutamine-hydrolysing)
LLASTDLVKHQAFAIRANAIGFQFHPEARAEGFERWLVGHAVEIAHAGIDPRRLRADMQTHGEALAAKATHVLDLWLDQSDLKGVR